MLGRYTLRDGEPVEEPDLLKWGRWMEGTSRKVARDKLGEVVVSTVFLGLDHNWADDGPPILYETMVFGGPLNDEQQRYHTREGALSGHAEMVARVTGSEARRAAEE